MVRRARAAKASKGLAKKAKKKVPSKTKVRKSAVAKKAVPRKKPKKSATKKSAPKKSAKPAAASIVVNARLTGRNRARFAERFALDKSTAVGTCVNKFMDTYHPGWNADLHGDSRKLVQDYHEQPVLFLDAINTCLKPHYSFVTTPDLVQTCTTEKLSTIKYEIIQVAA